MVKVNKIDHEKIKDFIEEIPDKYRCIICGGEIWMSVHMAYSHIRRHIINMHPEYLGKIYEISDDPNSLFNSPEYISKFKKVQLPDGSYKVEEIPGSIPEKERKKESLTRTNALKKERKRIYEEYKEMKLKDEENNIVNLKPWKDPESLFCSKKLSEIIKKDVATCEEIKDVDNIEILIDEMNIFSDAMKYEEANDSLNKIKHELSKRELNEYIRIFNIQTIKDIYILITSDSIRLNMEDYKVGDFISLLMGLKGRKGELQGGRYGDVDRQRKIVAEEMVKVRIVIPTKFKKVKPNRRFLDIAYKVNPSLVCGEIERREKTKLFIAIKKENIKEVKKSVDLMKKIKDDKII